MENRACHSGATLLIRVPVMKPALLRMRSQPPRGLLRCGASTTSDTRRRQPSYGPLLEVKDGLDMVFTLD